jgi:hypothetical protein
MKEFVNFLLANKCYESFLYNLQRRGYENIEKLFKSTSAYNVISKAFDWDTTRQGQDYWRDLSHEWDEICNSKPMYK